MTKKLTDFEKNSNKMRRSSLLFIKRLLKDKSVIVNLSMDNMIGKYEPDGRFHYTGEHKITLDWWAKVK